MENYLINKRRRSPIWLMPKVEFINLVQRCKTKKEILEFFYPSNYRWNYNTLNTRIKEEKIDTKHLEYHVKKMVIDKLKSNGKIKELSIEEICVVNSKYTYGRGIKNKLIKAGILEEKCSKCGIGPVWQNEKLALQLDHINGINNDNRISNLRLLCPNCHSQTSTFAGKNSTLRKFYGKPICRKCQNPISKQSKSGYCYICVKKHRKNIVVNKDNFCKNCNCKISRRSNSGFCSKCVSELQRKTIRPTKKQLFHLILNHPFSKIAEMYSVSDNAIRKWCKYYDLPYRKKDIEEYKNKHLLVNV